MHQPAADVSERVVHVEAGCHAPASRRRCFRSSSRVRARSAVRANAGNGHFAKLDGLAGRTRTSVSDRRRFVAHGIAAHETVVPTLFLAMVVGVVWQRA